MPFPEGEGYDGGVGVCGMVGGVPPVDISATLNDPGAIPWGAEDADGVAPGEYGAGFPPPDCAIEDISDCMVRISIFWNGTLAKGDSPSPVPMSFDSFFPF